MNTNSTNTPSFTINLQKEAVHVFPRCRHSCAQAHLLGELCGHLNLCLRSWSLMANYDKTSNTGSCLEQKIEMPLWLILIAGRNQILFPCHKKLLQCDRNVDRSTLGGSVILQANWERSKCWLVSFLHLGSFKHITGARQSPTKTLQLRGMASGTGWYQPVPCTQIPTPYM